MNGSKLRKIREELGYTQEDLAEALGVAVLQINRYENNKTKPNADMVAKVAQILSISSDYLLDLSDDPTPSNLSTGLNTKERALISAWRNGDYKRAMKVLTSDE